MYLRSLLLLVTAVVASPVRAQVAATCTPEHAAMGHCTMPAGSQAEGAGSADHTMHRMQAVLPSAPMTRDGSGTSWNPDRSPMEGLHGRAGAWHTMLHGTITPRLTAQDVFGAGVRGETRLSAPNWAMGMARRALGAGQLLVRGMVSLDPITEGKAGYPLLFQTGEAVDGRPLVDEQHPHDLFSELSLTYALPVGERASVFAYAAYPGEPALGPTAFMHRPSARHLPDAPLSHHWQDATHIVFGVATVGAAAGPFKVDASVFTGQEPDDERWGFDRPRFDSYSARVTFAPNEGWAFQASSAFIKAPEELHPGLDVIRTTASALHARTTARGSWTNALVWGYNAARENGAASGHHSGHAVLLESDLTRGAGAFFGRAEWVQKSSEELNLVQHGRLAVGSLTVGAARSIVRVGGVDAMLGASGTTYAVPEAARGAYGTMPVSAQVFLRLNLDR